MDGPDPRGRCDACCRTNLVLYKVSMGHDFFERPYDRLSVVDDQSPRWYCEECSREKDFQRDIRSIRDEFRNLREGRPSLLSDPAIFARARERVEKIDRQIKKGRTPHTILSPRDVALLLMEIDQYAEGHDLEG